MSQASRYAFGSGFTKAGIANIMENRGQETVFIDFMYILEQFTREIGIIQSTPTMKGDYYSLSCEPTLGECQILHSMSKRKIIRTWDAIKLIGDGQEQKLKKDRVIESWIKFFRRTYRRFMVIIIHLHELIVNASQSKTHYSLQGQVLINSLQSDSCVNVLANFRRRKMIKFLEGSSVDVGLADARRRKEHPGPKVKGRQDYLPREKLDKYLNPNPSSSQRSLVPRGMAEDELTAELTTKFKSLTSQLLGSYQKDAS